MVTAKLEYITGHTVCIGSAHNVFKLYKDIADDVRFNYELIFNDGELHAVMDDYNDTHKMPDIYVGALIKKAVLKSVTNCMIKVSGIGFIVTTDGKYSVTYVAIDALRAIITSIQRIDECVIVNGAGRLFACGGGAQKLFTFARNLKDYDLFFIGSENIFRDIHSNKSESAILIEDAVLYPGAIFDTQKYTFLAVADKTLIRCMDARHNYFDVRVLPLVGTSLVAVTNISPLS